MPPKPKFTREEIIDAAVALVSEKGISALTARDLGARLGSSPRPIFTVFKNMEELHQEVRRAVLKKAETCVEEASRYSPAFKRFGVQMILFAMEQPRLYQLLFMDGIGQARSFGEIIGDFGKPVEASLEIIKRDYGLDEAQARALFQHVWIYTFGIGALCATGMCRFSEEEINDLLGQDFKAMLARIKSGGLEESTPFPKEEKKPAPPEKGNGEESV